MLTVSQIWVYPFKSSQGISVESSAFDQEGICNDRRLVALDKNGLFLTARRYAELLQLRCSKTATGWRLQHPTIDRVCEINVANLNATVTGVIWKDPLSAKDGGDEAADWLSELLGVTARVALWQPQSRLSSKYALETSFADAAPILFASEASTEQVCQWAGIATDIRRFRPNIVIKGAEAFAEDSWRKLRIGGHTFTILDPCSRCILTTRDPDTGESHPDKEPMQTLKKQHASAEGEPLFGMNATLDTSVNGVVGDSMITVGDEVEILNS